MRESTLKGRPLNAKAFRQLIAKNKPRDDEFSVLQLLPLKLAIMASMREIELVNLFMDVLITPTDELREIFNLPETIAHNGTEKVGTFECRVTGRRP